MVKLGPDLRVLRAERGETEPLAQWLESDEPLAPEARQFLAKFVRGEVLFPPGNRRTIAAEEADFQLLIEVWSIAQAEQLSKSAARIVYAERKGLNEETVKSRLQRAIRECEERSGVDPFKDW